jgi:putative ABC transport system substrate-binding protein
MERRTFLGVIAGSLIAAPLAAEGQQAGKVPRIAFIFANTPETEITGPRPTNRLARAFLEGMRELGWVDGQNITIVRKSAEGHPDRYIGLAQEVVSLKMDLMVVSGAGPLTAMMQATDTIPIVSAGALTDPVAQGLTKSLGRPGGNVTGLTLIVSTALAAKRLQLLKEAVPKISRVALLTNPGSLGGAAEAARALKLTLLPIIVETPDGLQTAFATVTRQHVDALFVVYDSFLFAYRGAIIEYAAKQQLPASYPSDFYVEDGGLMSYGANYVDIFRRSAIYVDKILKGATPADLPIEQPTKFDLVINLKTATALGLTIPPSLLQRADQVIE